MYKRPIRIGLIVLTLGAITFASFLLADALSSNIQLRNVITSAGIFGPILVALVSGLNPLLPMPPSTFAPLFIESGFSPALVIAGFVIGTTVADSIGYFIGWIGSGYANRSYPEYTERISRFLFDHHHWVLPVTFLYFTFAPLPNEIILIPLALSGYHYRILIIPIIIGNIIHHTLLVLGYQTVFTFFFG